MTVSTTAELRAARCTPLAQAARMDAAACTAQLAAVPAWRCIDNALEREFAFADFQHTMAFVNALAWIADREDHHPDLQVGYGRCRVRWNTHSAGGVTLNDFICAAKVDALVDDAG